MTKGNLNTYSDCNSEQTVWLNWSDQVECIIPLSEATRNCQCPINARKLHPKLDLPSDSQMKKDWNRINKAPLLLLYWFIFNNASQSEKKKLCRLPLCLACVGPDVDGVEMQKKKVKKKWFERDDSDVQVHDMQLNPQFIFLLLHLPHHSKWATDPGFGTRGVYWMRRYHSHTQIEK